MPFIPHDVPSLPSAFERVASALDPVLTPLGFAPGQSGGSDDRGQVIFCRGFHESTDGACVDLVIDLQAKPDWRIVDVRYWGHPSERWHLPFDPHSDLAVQLLELARTLPSALL